MLPTAEEMKAARENPEFLYVNLASTWAKRDGSTGEMMEGGFKLAWGAKNLGFGEIEFHQAGLDHDSQKIQCRSERMGPDFVKKVLDHFMRNVEIVE